MVYIQQTLYRCTYCYLFIVHSSNHIYNRAATQDTKTPAPKIFTAHRNVNYGKICNENLRAVAFLLAWNKHYRIFCRRATIECSLKYKHCHHTAVAAFHHAIFIKDSFRIHHFGSQIEQMNIASQLLVYFFCFFLIIIGGCVFTNNALMKMNALSQLSQFKSQQQSVPSATILQYFPSCGIVKLLNHSQNIRACIVVPVAWPFVRQK